MKLVDRNNPRKLYLQLVEIYQDAIVRGEYPVGKKLPTEDQICSQQGVSKAVVRAAMEDLARRGFIRKIAGKGTFAQKPADAEGVWLSTCLQEKLLDFGMEWETEVIQKMLSVSPSDLRDLFASETEHKVFKIIRLRSINEEPVVHETAYVSYDLCPGMTVEDLRHESIIDLINNKYGIPIVRCADSMGLTTLEDKESELLKKETGAPALLSDRIIYTNNSRVVGFIRYINVSETHRISYEAIRANRN